MTRPSEQGRLFFILKGLASKKLFIEGVEDDGDKRPMPKKVTVDQKISKAIDQVFAADVAHIHLRSALDGSEYRLTVVPGEGVEGFIVDYGAREPEDIDYIRTVMGKMVNA